MQLVSIVILRLPIGQLLTSFLANGNISVTQAATFGAYAIAAKLQGRDSFSTTQAITAISILNVMMLPLSALLGNIPSSFSVFACFRRFEDFLALEERVDRRMIGASAGEKAVSAASTDSGSVNDGIEMGNVGSRKLTGVPISITGGDFNWGERAVLQDVNTVLPTSDTGSLTTIVGPVGCGKSTLLKAILGETASANGVVSLNSSNVSFCDQTPWIMNASIKDNIIAESKRFEEPWFDAVVEACDLSIDLGLFPDGALTMVGDKGLKLSGGQKQRIVSLSKLSA